MASEKKAPNLAPDAPFSNLLASRPPTSAGGTAAATFVSLIVHGAVMGALVWATQAIAAEVTDEEEEVTIIELPPELELPPPPPPPDQPQPQVTSTEVRGFQTLAVPDIVPTDIPPPNPTQVFREQDFLGVGVRGGVGDGKVSETGDAVPLSEAPRFVPMTVRPQILNSEEVVRGLERNYPPLLRDAGIGGETTVWFFIDEEGKVLKRQIDSSSGYDALDQAALKVAEIIRFSPAQNRDKKVQVWVSLPIKFSTR